MNDEWQDRELKGEVVAHHNAVYHSEDAGEKHETQISNNMTAIRNKNLPDTSPTEFLLDIVSSSSNFVFQREVALLVVLPFVCVMITA
jgi:hypothetical protein